MRSCALLLLTLFCAPLYAAVVIGQVYDVLEKDPVESLKARAATVDWHALYQHRKESWRTDLSATSLPRTTTHQVRYVEPQATLAHAVLGQQGEVLYPEGFQYNQLDFIQLPYRIFVVDEKDITWLSTQMRLGDKVLLNRGSLKKAAEQIKGPVYILDKLTREALHPRVSPSIIEQVGNRLKITEVVNES